MCGNAFPQPKKVWECRSHAFPPHYTPASVTGEIMINTRQFYSSAGKRTIRERHECISEAKVTHVQMRLTIRVARWSVFHRPGRYFTANL